MHNLLRDSVFLFINFVVKSLTLVVGGMSQIVLLGSLTHVFVLRLQHVTPGQSLSLLQVTPVEVAVAVVLIKDVKDSTMIVAHPFLSLLGGAV